MKTFLSILMVALGVSVGAQQPPMLRNPYTTNNSTGADAQVLSIAAAKTNGSAYNLKVFSSGVQTVQTNVVYASAIGCVLNAAITNGVDDEDAAYQGITGTDDTSKLQAVLNRATNGRPIELVMDGFAAVTGLVVYSNTTIRCLENGGFALLSQSGWPILRNGNPTTNAIVDQNITLDGGLYFGNGDWEKGSTLDAAFSLPTFTNNPAFGDFFWTTIGFYGIKNLTIKNVRLYPGKYANLQYTATICNWSNVVVQNCELQAGLNPGKDGLHFFSGTNLTVQNCRGQTGSDFVALNSSDYHEIGAEAASPWVIFDGNIYDVLIEGLQFQNSANGVGILAARKNINNVTVRNVTGTVREYAVSVWNAWPTNYVGGRIGNVFLENISVTYGGGLLYGTVPSIVWIGAYDTGTNYVDNVQIKNCKWAGETSNRPWLLLGPRTTISSLSISGMGVTETTANNNNRSIVQVISNTIATSISISDVTWVRPAGASTAGYVLSVTNTSVVGSLSLANYQLAPSLSGVLRSSGVISNQITSFYSMVKLSSQPAAPRPEYIGAGNGVDWVSNHFRYYSWTDDGTTSNAAVKIAP